MNPKITVITTFFNSQETIAGNIESILNQSLDDFEFVLVDDGSTDKTINVIKSFRDNRIKIIKSAHIGIAKALNLGLTNAKGKYIAILDADDESLPQRLSTQSYALQEKSISLIASNANLIDVKGMKFGQTDFPVSHEELVLNLLNLKPFPHSSVMFRRDIMEELGGYNERCQKSIDYNFYLEMIQADKRIHCLEENLINLRRYPGSWGVSDQKSLQFFYGFLGLVAYFVYKRNNINLMRIDKQKFEVIEGLLSKWFYSSSIYKKSMAKKHFFEARTSIRKFDIFNFVKNSVRAFTFDPIFLAYRGVNFSESDVLSFLDYIYKESEEGKRIITNVK